MMMLHSVSSANNINKPMFANQVLQCPQAANIVDLEVYTALTFVDNLSLIRHI